jgi:hypothetical protein
MSKPVMRAKQKQITRSDITNENHSQFFITDNRDILFFECENALNHRATHDFLTEE